MNGSMETKIDELEQEVLELLLAGDDPVLAMLRLQLANVTQRPRELSGVGFFTRFEVSEQAPQILGNPSFGFGDVTGEIEGLTRGADFVLFIDKGLLSMLEVCTYEEPWPREFKTFKLKYMSGKIRDFASLRATPGWPSRNAEY